MGSSDPVGSGEPGEVRVLTKAFALLDLFLGRPGIEHSASFLGETLGLSRTTTYRLLRSLEAAQLIRREIGGNYRLGPKAAALGYAAQTGFDLRTVAEPLVRQLAIKTGQTAFLFTPLDHAALCVLRVPGRAIEVLAVDERETLPYHAGAGSMALLAGLEDKEIWRRLGPPPFEAFTDYTARTPADVLAQVSATRSRGHALSWQDVTLGVAALGIAIGAGVLGPIGAISLAGIISVFTTGAQEDFTRELQATADEILRRLRVDPRDRTDAL